MQLPPFSYRFRERTTVPKGAVRAVRVAGEHLLLKLGEHFHLLPEETSCKCRTLHCGGFGSSQFWCHDIQSNGSTSQSGSEELHLPPPIHGGCHIPYRNLFIFGVQSGFAPQSMPESCTVAVGLSLCCGCLAQGAPDGNRADGTGWEKTATGSL